MKKLIFITFLFLVSINTKAAEKTTLYFFMSNTCGHCTSALESINDLEGLYDNDFELVVIDVNEGDNFTLYSYAADYFSLEYYVPLFVVGDDFAITGYDDSVIEAALNASNDSVYTDIIESKLSDYITYTLKEACDVKGIIYYDEAENVLIEEESELDIVEDEAAVGDYSVTEENEVNEEFNYYTVFMGLAFVGIFAIAVFKLN